jgi:hypothetical protein
MKKFFKLLLLAWLLIHLGGGLFAGGDIVVQLRLYEGFRDKVDVSAVVVKSYYIDQFSGNLIMPEVEIEKEKKALMRIYNLTDIKNISTIDLTLQKGEKNSQSREISLNGRTLVMRLSTSAGQDDRFKMEALEKGKDQLLMETEIVMPQEKTAVLGFEDAESKIYFLAFNRRKDRWAKKELTKDMVPPKLLKMVEPGYPAGALKKGRWGHVFLMGYTDLEGSIYKLEVLKGDPELAGAAKEAVLQWKYRPWKIRGRAEPLRFILIFSFLIKDGQAKFKEQDLERVIQENRYLWKDRKQEKIDFEVSEENRWIMEALLVYGENKAR